MNTDVCGPMNTVSLSGKRYLVTFIDDFTGYTVIYLVSSKSEVFGKMKEFIEIGKTKFSRKVKVFRSDRGGEYLCGEVRKFLKVEAIRVHYTAAEQIGVAERKSRTFTKMARCMLLDTDLGNSFWAEAVMTANYIQNRLPAHLLKVTPYEGWNGSKPHLRNFKMFGSKCFVNVPAPRRRKLDNEGESMVFVGYDEQSERYRCSDRIVISRDVRFIMAGFSEDAIVKEVDQCQDLIVGELSEEKDEVTDSKRDFHGFGDSVDNGDLQVLKRSDRANEGISPQKFINKVSLEDSIEKEKLSDRSGSAEVVLADFLAGTLPAARLGSLL